MKRFVEGEDRSQGTLFPERLDDYIADDNPVRVIDAFVEELDLADLGFERVQPQATGRPGYHPASLLKIYVYGYLNRIQSSRRLERETQRNVEMMWLTGRLMPDFKTIADFRKDNGKAIRRVCREFIDLCRSMEMFTQAIVAIDGSKFKAVNSKDRNDTKASMKRRIARVEQHIERYLSLLDDVDKDEPSVRDTKVPELEDKIAALKERMQQLKKRERDVLAHPDQQISETDPDSRLMKKGGMGSQVSYNVQTAVDTKHKLIVAHDVTNAAVDRNQLFPLAGLTQHTLQQDEIKVLADRGYYKGRAIKDCYDAGIQVLVPKILTSGSKAAGRFGKQDFHYEEAADQYRCPAGEILQRRFNTVEAGNVLHVYFAPVSVCRNCALKSQCMTSAQRRIRRWEHEDLLDTMEQELRNTPDAMSVRSQTVEHPFGTLKAWMGSTHFLTRRLKNVRTEMSLHVLAYNLRRMMSIMGVVPLMEAIRA
ncbi:ISPsy6, transposase [gamma proteobacterium NOR5-3]|nr:ISPsy6, transposase [gamma proteobacterium NOR5-3]